MGRELEVLLIVNLFWAAATTILGHVFISPETSDIFSRYVQTTMSMEEMGQKVQGTLSAQTSIPVIDVGALIFYSGVILLDFITNFITAVPSMATALVDVFQHIFGIEAEVALILKGFVYIFILVVWMLYILQIVLSMRGGARVV